jgi:hypothetical protein
MLYSKNGSIPKPETDGTDSWIEVPDAPEATEGQEVIWCYPPGWVIRYPMPAQREGYRWSYYLGSGWVEYAIQEETQIDLTTLTDVNTLSSTDISSL